VLVLGKLFQSSLMFASKAKAYPIETPLKPEVHFGVWKKCTIKTGGM